MKALFIFRHVRPVAALPRSHHSPVKLTSAALWQSVEIPRPPEGNYFIMRLKLIACKSMSRELCYLSSLSQNNIDITFIRQGYHNAPDVLRQTLQNEIDSVESGRDPHTNELGGNGDKISPYNDEDFDAILIGYGLCSNGIAGLHSQRHPLVIPRGHDCITFFLGSKERYLEYFNTLPGCFWYTASWIENADMPCEASCQRQISFYREKGYDEEDLEDFLEDMNGWTKSYQNAAYIKMPFFDNPEHQKFTKDAADFYHWNYTLLDGDLSLMQKFLNGQWDEETFLTVPPGSRVVPSNDSRIITCAQP